MDSTIHDDTSAPQGDGAANRDGGEARRADPQPANQRAQTADDARASDGAQRWAHGDEERGEGTGDDYERAVSSQKLQDLFHDTLREGEERLARSWPALLATGAVGGIDVGTGVLGLLLVLTLTGSEVGGAIAFGLGFIALGLARSELFTENFLVPIAPIVARRARVWSLLRLWLGTLVMNLVGGWVMTLIVITALPETRPAAITLGEHFVHGGITMTSFASAVLGGVIITLMTWMQHGADSPVAKIIVAEGAGFLLAAGHLNHAIVASLEMFAALHAGATFGYGVWLGLLAWAVLGNVLGGILFVTVLRLVQVGSTAIHQESHRASRERPGVDI